MARNGWSRRFADPILLPNGGTLRTLRDAANYITKLPKREHDSPEWRTAIKVLMLVAASGGAACRILRAHLARPDHRNARHLSRLDVIDGRACAALCVSGERGTERETQSARHVHSAANRRIGRECGRSAVS